MFARREKECWDAGHEDSNPSSRVVAERPAPIGRKPRVRPGAGSGGGKGGSRWSGLHRFRASLERRPRVRSGRRTARGWHFCGTTQHCRSATSGWLPQVAKLPRDGPIWRGTFLIQAHPKRRREVAPGVFSRRSIPFVSRRRRSLALESGERPFSPSDTGGRAVHPGRFQAGRSSIRMWSFDRSIGHQMDFSSRSTSSIVETFARCRSRTTWARKRA